MTLNSKQQAVTQLCIYTGFRQENWAVANVAYQINWGRISLRISRVSVHGYGGLQNL